MAVADLFPDELVGLGAVLARVADRFDRNTARRTLVDDRDIQIPIEYQIQRARDRCRGHREDVRLEAMCLRGQESSLADTEAVLFVDDDESEGLETYVFLNERMGADQDVDLPFRKSSQGRPALRGTG